MSGVDAERIMQTERLWRAEGIGGHTGQWVLGVGGAGGEEGLRAARGVLVFLHGRGASAEGILGLHEALGRAGIMGIVPQAAGRTWYPQSFLAPLEANEPWLSSALSVVEGVVQRLITAGVASERVGIVGFSQGACLGLEYAARHARRYGAVIGFTGGLIGPAGTVRAYVGSLAGTPVFVGSGDPDPHVPFERVEETGRVLVGIGARVEVRRYPGMGHGINAEEVEIARGLVAGMVGEGE